MEQVRNVMAEALSCVVKFLCAKFNRKLEKDKKLFDEFKDELLPSSTIEYFREKNFRDPFSYKRLEPIYEIEWEAKKPEFEFLNKKLEKAKKELVSNIIHFKDVISPYTFLLENDVANDIMQIHENVDEEIIRDIHQTADKICDKYDELIKLGRRIL